MLDKQEKRNYYDYLNGVSTYKPNNKVINIKNLADDFLNKTLTMFLYKGLPDSLPYEELEKILQLNGMAFIFERNEELIAVPVTPLYDNVDIYGTPIKGQVYYKDTRESVEISLDDGVIIKNDFLGKGLTHLFDKYSYLINENTVTLNIASMWKRAEKIFIANDDSTAESVKTYLSKLEGGEFGHIATSLLYESLNVNTPQSSTDLHSLIELDNYIKSQFYNEIGLYSNSNMKKERLITSEVETGVNSIYPLVDNMLNNRKIAIEKINSKFNLNIEVEFTSSWEYRLNLGENIENVEELETEEVNENE